MQIGIASFAAVISDSASGLAMSPAERLGNLLEEITLADDLLPAIRKETLDLGK